MLTFLIYLSKIQEARESLYYWINNFILEIQVFIISDPFFKKLALFMILLCRTWITQ